MSKEKEKKDKKKKKKEKKEKDKEKKVTKEKKKKKKEKERKKLAAPTEDSTDNEPEADSADDEIEVGIADNREITVSVLVISYNQERYIEKALQSIVEQKVNFRYEILVGDDASTDKTPKIIHKFAKKYPHLFRVFCREKNLGAAHNFLDIAMKTKGKYTAGVEGDDFWCDKHKLQRQVDFLEAHPEYVSCGTSFHYVDTENNKIPDEAIPFWAKRDVSSANEMLEPRVFTLEDYNECCLPTHSSTLVSRNIFLNSRNQGIFSAMHDMGDQTIILLLLKEGDIYVMPEKTFCYRWVWGGGNNFMSRIEGHVFYPFEWYSYLMTIRRFAKKELGLQVTRDRYVKEAVFHMVDNFVHYPTRGRWSAIWGMLRKADRKGQIFWMFLKSAYLANTYPVVRNMYPLDKGAEIYRKINRSWRDFHKDLQGKKLVLYGAGGGCLDLLNEYYTKLPVELLVDTNEGRRNTWFMGYLIKEVANLWKMDRNNTVVLITTGYYYGDIITSLEQHGFRHYYVYPVMERKKWRNKPLDWMQAYIRDIRTW